MMGALPPNPRDLPLWANPGYSFIRADGGRPPAPGLGTESALGVAVGMTIADRLRTEPCENC